MAEDAPVPAPAVVQEEMQNEAELQMRDIGQRFGALPQDRDELLQLVEDAETWLTKTDQKKPGGMIDNHLCPTMDALISRDLLDYPDPDVKLAVTSCFAELIRISAPDSPYDDNVMKEVFQRIVETFADLGDTNSSSYKRRASILDSVATVKGCNMMLDLKLDRLILDMIHHFFKAACVNHSGDVIRWMEMILRVVIEEGDDVNPELASYLLHNLTKEAKVTLPTSFSLAERLVVLYKDKLKPVFVRLLKGTPLDNYSDVVTSLCQDPSNVVADFKNIDASVTDHMRDHPLGATSQEKKPVKTKRVSDLMSAKVNPNNYSGGRGTRRQSKDDRKPATNKLAEGKFPNKQQKASFELQKEDVVLDKGSDEDSSLKEVVSAPRMDKIEVPQEDSSVSKGKRPREAEQAPLSKKNEILDDNLVGTRIKVWWPEDEMFYDGIIESFNASSKEHKVVYDDGDVEILHLKNETWKLIDEEQGSDPDPASDTPHGKRGKRSSRLQTKEGEIGTPQSDIKGGNPPKKSGCPKGARNKNNMSYADSPAGSDNMKRKGAKKDTHVTPKPSSDLKRGGTRVTRSTGKA